MTEIEKAVKEMKSNTAPGPDGFPVGFYKQFWGKTKNLIKEVMDRLYEGNLNLSRLNYGLITLIRTIQAHMFTECVIQDCNKDTGKQTDKSSR